MTPRARSGIPPHAALHGWRPAGCKPPDTPFGRAGERRPEGEQGRPRTRAPRLAGAAHPRKSLPRGAALTCAGGTTTDLRDKRTQHMAYESRAYDNEHGDPVVVLVVTGTHDVSRLVNLFNGQTKGHMALCEHIG